jgi:phosphoribosylformylglycinamidine synthase I
MKNPKVCILRTAGTNCDKETAFAFQKAGASLEFVHVNRLVNATKNLADYQILAIAGGFSYGDDIAAGKILANELRNKLAGDLKKFIEAGKLIIGICNGFQILVKSGLLPGNAELKQETSLMINDSGKFEDRWVYLKSQGKCVWTKNLPEIVYLPVAHGEGKFVAKDKQVLNRLQKNQQVIFQYCNEKGVLSGYPDNPNGSIENIAGISDETGRILGLMPHPERHINIRQHPRWMALKFNKYGDGFQIFKNGVEYAKRIL